jgi:uncharacterized membrane protein
VHHHDPDRRGDGGIAGELPRAAHGDSLAKVRLIGTLVLTWLFANTVYGLHYAHLYYTRDVPGRDRGGLDFPATEPRTTLISRTFPLLWA